MALENYYIRKIQYQEAIRMVEKFHYLHRACPCEYAFGLFDGGTVVQDGLFESHEMVGCIIYGTPSSAPLRSGICGPDESSNVIELTRLWIKDGTPKNSESFLIGRTIPLVGKEIIVSFAEIGAGHVGMVYQATNWIYTGLSAKRTDWHIEGVDLHGQTIADKYSADEVREIYGDRFSLKERGRKHRYIYFNTKDKKRKKELLSKLRYNVEPYPKK